MKWGFQILDDTEEGRQTIELHHRAQNLVDAFTDDLRQALDEYTRSFIRRLEHLQAENERLRRRLEEHTNG